jgi:DGQHR domain-containing protein
MSYKIETFNIKQNNQGFLLGIFKMSDLRNFVRFTERIVIEFDENNRPIYNDDIQRKISPSKVEGIADFLIHDIDAFFPTNVVVSIPSTAIEELQEIDDKHTNIYLKDSVIRENLKADGDIYITIIDGQHRIAGIERAIKKTLDEIRTFESLIRTSKESEKYTNEIVARHKLLRKLESFEIVVSFFIDPTLEYQAMIFSTINRTQTKVSEDLVYSLFGLSKEDSPQKTALEVVLALNATESSPFFNRIKLSGAKYQKSGIPPLSQAAMVKSILYWITPNLRQAEIEKNKKRDYLLEKKFDTFLPFRKYYGNGQDEKIIIIVNNFFKAVKIVFKNADGESFWDIEKTAYNVLQTTVGYQALMQILSELLLVCEEEQRFDFAYYCSKLQLAVGIDFEDAEEPKKFPFTSKTINILYNEIGKPIFGNKFIPKEIKE